MSLPYLIFLALGVSLDSFAIAVCKGIGEKKPFKLGTMCAISFTIFQLIMLTLGYFLGQTLENYIDKFDHYIVFAVLLIFGLNMIKEAFSKDNKKQNNSILGIILLAFFSSFDSLGVGITLAIFDTNLWICAGLVCVFTISFSFAGIYIGKYFGEKHKKIACIIGGVILIALGIKILCDHLI